MRAPAGRAPQGQYEDFVASEIYCPRCRMATPVRKRLLLVLLDGEKFDYVCARCGESVGSQTDTDARRNRLLIP